MIRSGSPLDGERVERILVVRLSSLGDVVLTTPALRALRLAFPSAEIVVAVERRFAAVLRRSPRIDRVIETADGIEGTLASWVAARRTLRREPPFDLALDLHGLRRSAIWVYASGARIQMGRGRPRPFWRSAVVPDLRRHAVEAAAEVLEAVGVPTVDLAPEIFLDDGVDRELERRLVDAGLPPRGFVVVHPCSRWTSKDWPIERYASVVAWVHGELALPVVLSGSPDDRTTTRRLASLVPPGAAVSLAGDLDLESSLCLYRRARILVAGDTGPMHAAAALGAPVVALFGPTLPQRTGPLGPGHQVVQSPHPPAEPTYREDGEAALMRSIEVDAVRAAVLRALDAAARSG